MSVNGVISNPALLFYVYDGESLLYLCANGRDKLSTCKSKASLPSSFCMHKADKMKEILELHKRIALLAYYFSYYFSSPSVMWFNAFLN